MLAQKFGVAIPEESESTADGPRQDARLREELLKVHEVAAGYFKEQLEERGVAGETIEQLGLGYAPPSRNGLRAGLLAQGFSQGLLLQSGLILQRDGGEVVDRFRNRLMIPI